MSLSFKTWRAAVQGSGSRVSDELQLSLALNNFAGATASLFPGDTTGVAKVPLDEMAAALGAAQQRAFSSTSSSFTASVSADGSDLRYEGFETQPAFSAAVPAFAPRLQAVHATSRIGRLQLDLYADTPNAALDTVQTPNLPERILEIVQRMVRTWIKDTYPALPDRDKVTALAIHRANEEPLQIFQRILQNSPQFEMPELNDLLETADAWHDGFNQWIARSLLVGRGDFWSAFTGLLGQLGMTYCPEFGAAQSNGRVVSIGDMLRNPTERTDLPGLRIDGAVMPPENPITRVIIEKVPTAGVWRHRPEDQASRVPGQAAPTSIVFPTGNRIGKAYVMQPPAFMGQVLYNTTTQPVSNPSLTPGQARARIAKLNTITEQRAASIRKYLTAVARNVFRMLALQSSTVSVTLPLSLSWQVGSAYDIGVSGKLFSGLLSGLQHNLSSGGANVSTQLHFSHVQWNGFSVESLES